MAIHHYILTYRQFRVAMWPNLHVFVLGEENPSILMKTYTGLERLGSDVRFESLLHCL